MLKYAYVMVKCTATGSNKRILRHNFQNTLKKVDYFLVYNTLLYFPSVATFMTFVLLHKTHKVKNKVLSICQKNYSVV